MFNGLFKPKFYSKCKSYIQHTKLRLDDIRKKTSVVARILKNDLGELMRNGLDYNAYGKVDSLLSEQNMLGCYDLIDNFCDIVNQNLSMMLKEIECPRECREPVASLIYAAARFARLPELCHLRSLFTEKYGDSLESFTNKEFKEKFRAKHHTKEMMLQLMHAIAKEGSIEWSSKVLEQNLQPSPPPKKPDLGNIRLEANNSQDQVKNDRNASNLAADSSSEDDSSTDQDVGRSVSEEVDNQKKINLRKSTSDAPATLNIHPSDDQENDHNYTSEGVEKPNPRHVHPNLPDYDELVARFTALKIRDGQPKPNPRSQLDPQLLGRACNEKFEFFLIWVGFLSIVWFLGRAFIFTKPASPTQE